MKKIVLDTDILIDNVHGFAGWIKSLLALPEEFQLVTPTVVIAEYLTALENETSEGYKKSKKYLSMFVQQDLTAEVADVLGRILRRKIYASGASFPDLIIASTAIYLDAELATRNKRHFQGIPDLRFFDPKKLDY